MLFWPADYTISTLVNNSILKDEGTGDGGLFKGIFDPLFAQDSDPIRTAWMQVLNDVMCSS